MEDRVRTPLVRRQLPTFRPSPTSTSSGRSPLSRLQRIRLFLARDVPRGMSLCLEEVTYLDIMLWTALLIIFACFFVWVAIKFSMGPHDSPSLRFKRNALLVDDDESFKVSADNADFQTLLVVDQGTETDDNDTLIADIEEVAGTTFPAPHIINDIDKEIFAEKLIGSSTESGIDVTTSGNEVDSSSLDVTDSVVDVTSSTFDVSSSIIDVTPSIIDITNASDAVTAGVGIHVIDDTMASDDVMSTVDDVMSTGDDVMSTGDDVINISDDVMNFGDEVINLSGDVRPGSDFHFIDDTIKSGDIQSMQVVEIDSTVTVNEVTTIEHEVETSSNQNKDAVEPDDEVIDIGVGSPQNIIEILTIAVHQDAIQNINNETTSMESNLETDETFLDVSTENETATEIVEVMSIELITDKGVTESSTNVVTISEAMVTDSVNTTTTSTTTISTTTTSTTTTISTITISTTTTSTTTSTTTQPTTTTTQLPYCESEYCQYISSLSVKPQVEDKQCLDLTRVRCTRQNKDDNKDLLWTEVEHKLNITAEKQNKTNLELNVHRFYSSCASWEGSYQDVAKILLDIEFPEDPKQQNFVHLMEKGLNKFPNLNPFGKLKQEFKKGRTQKYLVPDKSADHDSSEDRVQFIAATLQKVFMSMKEQRNKAETVAAKVEPAAPRVNEGGSNLNLPNTVPDRNQLVSGCRCFCNKQLAEICQAYQPPTPTILRSSEEARGKSLPHEPPEIEANGISNVTENNHNTTTTSVTEATTAESSTIESETNVITTKSTENEDLMTTVQTSLDTTTEIVDDNATTVSPITTSTAVNAVIETNPTVLIEAVIEEANDLELNDEIVTDEQNVTVVYAAKTYQTVQAYGVQERSARSIIDTIPQLSNKQIMLKEELEKLRVIAVKIIGIEEKFKQLELSNDNHETGEDGVGPWLQKIAWFSIGTGSHIRSSKYADKVEDLLDETTEEDKYYYLLWKTVELLQKRIPGLVNQQNVNSTFCLQNVYEYFPQFFYPDILKNISDETEKYLQEKETSQHVIKNINNLNQRLFNTNNENAANNSANFLEQLTAVNSEVMNEDDQYLRNNWADTVDIYQDPKSELYSFYEASKLLLEYVFEFTSDNQDYTLKSNKNNVENFVYNITQTWSKSNQVYNIEIFGVLTLNEMFSIESASRHCSNINWNKYFDFTCNINE